MRRLALAAVVCLVACRRDVPGGVEAAPTTSAPTTSADPGERAAPGLRMAGRLRVRTPVEAPCTRRQVAGYGVMLEERDRTDPRLWTPVFSEGKTGALDIVGPRVLTIGEGATVSLNVTKDLSSTELAPASLPARLREELAKRAPGAGLVRCTESRVVDGQDVWVTSSASTTGGAEGRAVLRGDVRLADSDALPKVAPGRAPF